MDPQFRMATPEGNFHLALVLPVDDYERKAMFRRIASLMAFKMAAAFTLAVELVEPDCLTCVGVSHSEVQTCALDITRAPRPWTASSFGALEWLPRSSISAEILDLLPRGRHEVTAKDIAAMDKWFGVRGRFPLVHIESGKLGL